MWPASDTGAFGVDITEPLAGRAHTVGAVELCVQGGGTVDVERVELVQPHAITLLSAGLRTTTTGTLLGEGAGNQLVAEGFRATPVTVTQVCTSSSQGAASPAAVVELALAVAPTSWPATSTGVTITWRTDSGQEGATSIPLHLAFCRTAKGC